MKPILDVCGGGRMFYFDKAEVLKCFSIAPLLGQRTVAETHWLVFFKGIKDEL